MPEHSPVAFTAGIAPMRICILGNFEVLRAGQAAAIPLGGKTEILLSHLALKYRSHVPRSTLLDMLWPEWDAARGSQSFHSLVYSVHKLLGNAPDGNPPVMQADGYCWLNTHIEVDTVCFGELADRGDRCARAGNQAAAAEAYNQAIALYRGDLCSGSDITAVVEREHLRARYLTLLAWLADYSFAEQNYMTSLEFAAIVLQHDPFREDAHRMAMRCYVRRGERGQALRQYRLCQSVLRAEFDAAPERATAALYEQIRLDPDAI